MDEFRATLQASDEVAVERLVSATGAFSAEEIMIARELVEETRANVKGADYRFLIADGDEGICGYTCYGPIPGTDHRYELYWIAVDPATHRRGLGHALLAATEAAVKELGGTHLFAETSTRPDYMAARGFYSANGYRLHAEVPDFHADGDGLAIYGKRL